MTAGTTIESSRAPVERSARLGITTQLVCCWITIASLGLTGVAFFLVSGYVPPPHADASAAQIAQFYVEHKDRIRVGLVLLLISWVGWGTLVAGVATQMARIEGVRPVLTNLQLLSGGVGWICLIFPTMFLGIASFRPERSPELTQALHDLGWITAFLPFMPFMVQAVAIAVAAFSDPSGDPVFPRWFAYFNIWAALLFAPGGMLLFFKTGPFSYHGLFVFWVPFVVFGAWILLIALMVRRAVLAEARSIARFDDREDL